jgi:hypothetical protein
MSVQINSLIPLLKPDSWRLDVGFNSDIEITNQKIFSCNSEEEVGAVLNEWIGKYQPCLFGKIAAQLGLLSYCILSESDLEKSDLYIRDKIQDARRKWKREGDIGEKSGFVILVVSKNIALAQPDNVVKEIAQRICSLYLIKER